MPDTTTTAPRPTSREHLAPAGTRPRRTTARRLALYVGVTLGAAIMLFPFLWTVITSITPDGTLASGPTLIVEDPTLDAYARLLEAMPMWRIVANSFGIAIASTLLQLVTGSMAGYAFGRLTFRGKNVVFALYLATLMIPLQVLVDRKSVV